MQNALLETNNTYENGEFDPIYDDPVEIDPRSARKEAVNDMKRNLIMDAALRVIARNGYVDVRIEEIAEEAGFSKASIYHYFPDKEAIFINAVIKEQRAVYDKCAEIVERGMPFLDTIKELAAVLYGQQNLAGAGAGSATMSPVAYMSSVMVSITKHENLMTESIATKLNTHLLMKRVVAKAREDGVLTIPVSDTAVCMMINSFINVAAVGKSFSGWIKTSIAEINAKAGAQASVWNKVDEAGFVDTLEELDINKAIDALTVFLEPWIKK